MIEHLYDDGVTRPVADLDAVLALSAAGATATAIAHSTGLPRSTVRDWLPGRGLRSDRTVHDEDTCTTRDDASADYALVLGIYLGDGCLSQQRNGVWKLRVVGDARYPDVLDERSLAISSVLPRQVGRVQREGCVELTSHSKHWICLLPQHGAGKKHERQIALEDWQHAVVDRHPVPFVRGLLFSDGCRVVNRVGKYTYGRYFMSNHSTEILELTAHVLTDLGARPRINRRAVSVARREDVAMLDLLVGRKH